MVKTKKIYNNLGNTFSDGKNIGPQGARIGIFYIVQ